MILFKKLRYQNFLSTGNIFTEIILNKSKNTLIVGVNGVGKSTFIDALSFVLYNKAHRNINKPQLVNSITSKDCLVEIEFSVGSNEYVVRRGIKPSLFEIYKNDKLVNQNAENRDYQKYLEDYILKMNHKTFSQIVLLGRANFTPFMALPAQGRRQVIEDLLDIQIFSVMNSLLKDRINNNKQQIINNTHSLELIKSKLEMQQKHIEALKANNDELIKNKILKLEELNVEIQNKRSLLQEVKSSLSSCESIKKDLDIFTKRKTKEESIYHQLVRKQESIIKSISFYEDSSSCPTCKQAISDDFKTKTIDEKRTQIKEIEEAILTLETATEGTTQEIKKTKNLLESYNSFVKRETELNSSISFSIRMVNEINNEIELLKTKSSNIEPLENYEKKLLELETEKEKLLNDKEIMTASFDLLKDSGIKTKIIKQYVPIINTLINKYLSMMDFFVQFEIDESFNEKIKSRFRDDFSYESFSEGEKVRLDLALLFSWRALTKLRNSSTSNLLILDEIFDSSLDLSGTEEFMKILSTLTGDTNVFVISHKTDQLIDKFENVIKFKKERNYSIMEN